MFDFVDVHAFTWIQDTNKYNDKTNLLAKLNTQQEKLSELTIEALLKLYNTKS